MPLPSVEFLFDASLRSLEDAELAELNRSNNLAKGIRVEHEAMVEAIAAAMVLRWMMDNREVLLSRKEVVMPAAPKKVRNLFENPKSNSA